MEITGKAVSHGYLVEVFTSYQGEGLRLGEKQMFIRLGGCNLLCDYCDEPETVPVPSGNRVSLVQAQARILRERERHPEVLTCSVTGGEPLLQSAFLQELLPWLDSLGFLICLETNGVLHQPLKKVLPWCGIISMDINLPSATGRKLLSNHREFLRIAPKKTAVKVVLTHRTREEELLEAVRLVEEVSAEIPFILQPATPFAGVRPPDPGRVLSWWGKSRAILKHVFLIPQWHPLWGLP